jgi:hypothetical protein
MLPLNSRPVFIFSALQSLKPSSNWLMIKLIGFFIQIYFLHFGIDKNHENMIQSIIWDK